MAPKADSRKICWKYCGPIDAPLNPPQTNPPSA